MSKIKTAIVVGAGAWGGWTAYMLQKSGVQVKLIDQFGPGNKLSGSGGQTRVIRMAYGGHELYTELTGRSFELWAQYEQVWQEQFYHQTGSIWLFRGIDPAYACLSQPLLEKRGLSLNELPLEEARRLYPQIHFEDITHTFFEPLSGYLMASHACRVVKEQFEKIGGEYLSAKVTGLNGNGQFESVSLEDGETLQADACVLACGPWTQQLVPAVQDLVRVSRQEVYFFDTDTEHGPGHLPIWIEFREGEHMYYGIPGDEQTGFKMAYDERTWPLDPDKDHREVTPEILAEMRTIKSHRFPGMEDKSLKGHHTCVYESSLDGDFIMDRIPGFNNAVFFCGSSGHGFKMGPAIGEMVSNAVIHHQPLPEIFSLKRFENFSQRKTQYQVNG